jgi:tape measure domain-containing protein
VADKEKRLKVSVDGSGAERDINRISAAFTRLNASIASASQQLTRFQTSLSASMARMSSHVNGLTNALRTGLGTGLTAAGNGFAMLGRAGTATLAGLSGAMSGVVAAAGMFINVFRTITRTVILGGVAFAGFAAAIADAGIKTDRFVNTLVVLTGSTATAKQELSGLFETADRLGTSFSAAATPFAKFAAAAAGTLTRPEIRGIFESFTEVTTALQLQPAEVTGVFLALQQIASKGVVSMEELRLQLAERVPGAMRLAASSMNMTMGEFEKAVSEKTINAAEFLKNFSRILSDVFGDSAEIASNRLFANMNRLTNAFFMFRQQIFAGGFEAGLSKLIKSADDFLRRSPDLADLIGKMSESVLTRFADMINNIDTSDIVDMFNAVIGAVERLINSLSDLSYFIRKAFDDDFGNAVTSVQDRIRTINNSMQTRAQIGKTIFENNQPMGLVDSASLPIATFFGQTDAVESILKSTKLSRDEVQALDAEFNLASRDMAEAFYSKLKEDAAKVGLQLNIELPNNMEDLQQLFETTGQLLDTTREGITLGRIAPPSGARLGLNMGNIPESGGGLETGNTRAIQSMTDQMLNSEIPSFMSKARGDVQIEKMDELLRLSHELEVSEQARALLIDRITTKTEELATLRHHELDENGENVANQTRLQTELTTEMEKYNDLLKDINTLQEKQTDLIEKRQRDFEQWLSNQTLVKLATNLGFSFASAFEEAIIRAEEFQDVLKGLAEDVIRLTTRLLVTQPLASFLSSFIGGFLPIPGPGGLPSNIVDPTGFPGGGALPAHTGTAFVVPGAGGVDSKRVTMDVTPGERITVDPLYRQNRDKGELVVNAPETKIEIHNYSGQPVTEETTTSPDGSRLTKLIIGAVAEDLSRNGDISQIMRARFGLSARTSSR